MNPQQDKVVNRYPGKLLAKWGEGLAIATFTLVVGVLLFPFSFLNLILIIVVLLFGSGLRWIVRNRQAGSGRKWPLVVTLISGVTLGLATIALSPLIKRSDGAYVVLSPHTQNPFDAGNLHASIDSDGRQVAITVITDPIRRFLFLLLKSFPVQRAHVIDVDVFEGDYYLRLPLRTAHLRVEQTISATDLRVSERLDFLSTKAMIGSEEDPISKGQIGFQVHFGHSISWTYTIRDSAEMWHTVKCGQRVSDNALKYTALLDYALTQASLGNMDGGLSALFAAGKLAPTRVEALRVTILAAHWTQTVLGGPIGQLQSISLYKEAAVKWKSAFSERSMSGDEDLVLGWSRLKLLHGISRNKGLFEEELKLLEVTVVSEPPKVIDASTLKSMLPAELANGGYFQEYAVRVDNMTAAEFAAEASRVSRNRDQARLFIEVGMLKALRSFAATKDSSYITSLRGIVGSLSSEWRNIYRHVFDYFDILVAGSKDNPQNDVLLAKQSGLVQSAVFCERVHKDPTWRPEFMPSPPKRAWWNRDYIDWFLYNYLAMTRPTGKQIAPAQKLKIDMLMFDEAGSGRPFLPGIFLAYVMAEKADAVELKESCEREFRRAIGCTPREYVGRLGKDRSVQPTVDALKDEL